MNGQGGEAYGKTRTTDACIASTIRGVATQVPGIGLAGHLLMVSAEITLRQLVAQTMKRPESSQRWERRPFYYLWLWK